MPQLAKPLELVGREDRVREGESGVEAGSYCRQPYAALNHLSQCSPRLGRGGQLQPRRGPSVQLARRCSEAGSRIGEVLDIPVR